MRYSDDGPWQVYEHDAHSEAWGSPSVRKVPRSRYPLRHEAEREATELNEYAERLGLKRTYRVNHWHSGDTCRHGNPTDGSYNPCGECPCPAGGEHEWGIAEEYGTGREFPACENCHASPPPEEYPGP